MPRKARVPTLSRKESLILELLVEHELVVCQQPELERHPRLGPLLPAGLRELDDAAVQRPGFVACIGASLDEVADSSARQAEHERVGHEAIERRLKKA